MGKIKFSVVFYLLLFQLLFIYGQTTIQMKKEGGVYTIPCKINGLGLKFIFDTGASRVSISYTEALFMLKNGYLESNDVLGNENFVDARGKISVGTIINIKKIEFACLELNNISATIVHEF